MYVFAIVSESNHICGYIRYICVNISNTSEEANKVAQKFVLQNDTHDKINKKITIVQINVTDNSCYANEILKCDIVGCKENLESFGKTTIIMDVTYDVKQTKKEIEQDMYLDDFLEEHSISEDKLTFTCQGPQKHENVFCDPIDIKKLLKHYSSVFENTTTNILSDNELFTQLITSNEIKQKIQDILKTNITKNVKNIIEELSGIINLSTKKKVIGKYTIKQILNAVTQYVLNCFDEDGIFNCITEYTFKNDFNWVGDTYDREIIFAIANGNA